MKGSPLDEDTAIKPLHLPVVLPVLPGDRLVLRPLEDDDAAALFAIYGDPLVMKYTDEPPFEDLLTVGLMLKSVRGLLAGGESLEWGIAVHGGELVGTCGLHSFDAADMSAQVGCLLRHSAWGFGYMPEAIALLMGFAGSALGLRYLLADVDSENTRARKLFAKLGYLQLRSGMLKFGLGDAP